MICPKMTTSRGGELQFLATRVEIRLSANDNADRLSIIEHWLPHGDATPLHIHRNEDEVFYILRGTMRFEVAGKILHGNAGDVVMAPKGVPHRYLVTSEEGAQCMTIMTGSDFETMVRENSYPAHPLEAYARTDRDEDIMPRLMESLARNHIDVLGPPLAA